jgi:hypothetical protein
MGCERLYIGAVGTLGAVDVPPAFIYWNGGLAVCQSGIRLQTHRLSTGLAAFCHV